MLNRFRPPAPFLAAIIAVLLVSCGAAAKRGTSSYEAAVGSPPEPAYAKSSMSYGGYTTAESADYDYAMDEMAEYEPLSTGDMDGISGDVYPAPAAGPPAAPPPSGGEVMAALTMPADLEGMKYAQALKGTGKTEPATEKPEKTEAKAPERLILYTAEMSLAVFRVDEQIEEIRKMIKGWGGYLVSMDSNQIVFRVPAALFEEALDSISKLGDVTYRNVQGTDVTEEFRDLQIRLKNAEAVRDRLLELLSQAKNINESLQVEHELERITEKIELMKGRLKYLSEAAMYSKITVYLAVKKKAKKPIPPLYAPFRWIQDIGLDSLFNF